MPFNPKALNARTLKQFVDRLLKMQQGAPVPTPDTWPPKRAHVQEQIAIALGFSSWHEAIHAVQHQDAVEAPPLTRQTLPIPIPLHRYRLPADVLHLIQSIQNGLVLVAGETSSGKSHLMSSLLRETLEYRNQRNVYVFEAHDDFDYSAINQNDNRLHRVNILRDGLNLSPGEGAYETLVRRCLARRPTDIFVEEARDSGTIAEVITAAMTGHAVYTTVNASGCADAITSIIKRFERREHAARAVDILSSIRVLIAVKRVPGVDGGGAILTETLLMTDALIDQLIDGGVDGLESGVGRVIRTGGRGFEADALRKLDAGMITQEVYALVASGKI